MSLTESVLCLLCLVSAGIAEYNTIAMGPADVIFHAIEECPDIGKGELRFSFKLHRISRLQFSLDANTSSAIQIDDSYSFFCNSAQFTNGGWKENFFVKEFPKICMTAATIVPDMMKNIAAAAGYPNGDKCPISPKNYTMKNFKVDIDLSKVLPIFTYNKYRSDISLIKKGLVYGCFRIYTDLVPKRRATTKKKKI